MRVFISVEALRAEYEMIAENVSILSHGPLLVKGMFAILAHQRTMQEKGPDDGFASLCRLVLLLSVGLLMVGAWFVPAGWNEKIIYVAAWFVCLYGVSAMPHKALAAQAAQKDSSERP